MDWTKGSKNRIRDKDHITDHMMESSRRIVGNYLSIYIDK